MSEKLGVEKLKVVVVSVANILNAVSAFAHKAGLLSLYPVIGEAQSLVKEDWLAVKLEIQDLSAAESDEVENAFKVAIKLQNPNVQAKLSDAIDVAQEAAALVVDELAIVTRGKVLVEKVKQLLS